MNIVAISIEVAQISNAIFNLSDIYSFSPDLAPDIAFKHQESSKSADMP